MKKDYFNSHPHEEDDFHGYCKWMYLYISTHILTKRMTEHVVSIWNTTKHFNSHPHEEDDGCQKTAVSGRRNFNSHPHEEDDKQSPTH